MHVAPSPRYYLGLWAVYPLLVPFYLMGKTPIPGTAKVEGGVPQIADYYLLALMGLIFTTLPFRLSRATLAPVLALAGFVVYTAFINLAWAATLEDLSLLKATLFYAYDGMLLLTCLALYGIFQDAFLRVTVYAVGGSVVLQALLSPLAVTSASPRQALFFNDENQLGYFCVLAATIVVLGAQRFAIRPRYQAIFYGAIAYLALLAQSRGALLGLTALTVLALLGRPLRLLFVLGGAAILGAVLTLDPPSVSKTDERYVVGSEYDTAGGRGYDRIFNYPEHILVGAGEGAYARFRSDLYASELHSTYGTLLFCYGIPGTLLFTLGLVLFCRYEPRLALYLIPALIHGVGHQGLRFAFFWAMLAFLGTARSAAPKRRRTALLSRMANGRRPDETRHAAPVGCSQGADCRRPRCPRTYRLDARPGGRLHPGGRRHGAGVGRTVRQGGLPLLRLPARSRRRPQRRCARGRCLVAHHRPLSATDRPRLRHQARRLRMSRRAAGGRPGRRRHDHGTGLAVRRGRHRHALGARRRPAHAARRGAGRRPDDLPEPR